MTRESQKLSQAAFGASLDTSGQNINNIENDRTKPGFDVLQAIIEKYRVDADWLITGREKPVQIVQEPKEDPIQSMASWMAKVERDIYLLQQKVTLMK